MEVLSNLIIRPPRALYDPNRALPGPAIRIGDSTYHRRDLQLRGSNGHRLECSHYTPDEWPQPALPCVIFLHGNSGCRVDAFDAVRVLLPLNITVFCLDFAGSGLSEGKYVTLGVHECEDVRAVVTHLRSSGRVTKIGLWGRSMGAATSLFYGSKDPSIAALVLDSPFSRLTDLMMELVDVMAASRRMYVPRPLVHAAVALVRLSIQRRAHVDISQLDVTTAAARSFVPALFGHATGDTFIRPTHSQTLCNIYPGDKNFIQFDGTHNSARPQFFYDSVSIFFLNTLHPPQASDRDAGGQFVPAEMPPPAVSLGRPADSDVDKLLRMGFPRSAAERALRRYKGVELAATYLVDHASDGWPDLMADDTLTSALPGGSDGAASPRLSSPRLQVLPPVQEHACAFGDADDDGAAGHDEQTSSSDWVLPEDAVSHAPSGGQHGGEEDRLARALGISRGPARTGEAPLPPGGGPRISGGQWSAR